MVRQRIHSILEWLKSQPHQSLVEQIIYEWGELRIFSLRKSNEVILKEDAIARRKRSPGCRDKSAIFLAFQTVVLWISLTMCASIRADWIVLDGERHEDVLITAGATLYYVSFPKTGVTVSVNKSEVPESQVQIDNVPEKRKILFDQWKSSNEKLKSEREINKRLKAMQAESERMEKEKSEALAEETRKEVERLAEEEKNERDRLLAIEQEKANRGRLGKTAQELLTKAMEKLEENLKLADKLEAERLAVEFDATVRLVRVEHVRQSADPFHDPRGENTSQLKSKLSEIQQAMRERVKLYDRKADEPGLSRAKRKAAAVKALVDQGWDEDAAETSVGEMEESDMLPDPPANRISEDDSKPLRYTQSVRKLAVVMTLVDSGWTQSDAEIAADGMNERGVLPSSTSTTRRWISLNDHNTVIPHWLQSHPALATKPMSPPISDISFDTIMAAFDSITLPENWDDGLTQIQKEVVQKEKNSKYQAMRACVAGLRVSWRGELAEVHKSSYVDVSMIPQVTHYGVVSFHLKTEDALALRKGQQLSFEGTLHIGETHYDIWLSEAAIK